MKLTALTRIQLITPVFALGLGLFFGAMNTFASEEKTPPTVATTRYIDANNIVQFTYNLDPINGTEFTSKFGRGADVCDGLLTEQNAAGLAKTKLPDDLKSTYIELSKSIQGITFVETMGDPTNDTSLPELEYQKLHSTHADSGEKLRTAVAWVIPNRYPYVAGLKNQLPWQKETVFQNAKAHIEVSQTGSNELPVNSRLLPGRHFDSIDFEFGRLTQFVSGHGKWLYPSLGLTALTQVISSGANPHQSYIYLHSASPVNTRLYKSKLDRDPIFTAEENGVQHSLFKVPLTHYLEVFPPSEVSKILRDLKGILPSLKEWQLALMVKEYYDLTEFYAESKISATSLPIRTRVWSKKYKRMILDTIHERFGINKTTGDRIFALFASQNAAPVSSEQVSSLSSIKDFLVQFQFTENEHVQFEIPDEMSTLHLQNPHVIPEFLAQSYLYLLRLPADANRPDMTPQLENQILMKNKDDLLAHNIDLVYSTDDIEIAKTLLAVGGVSVPVRGQDSTRTSQTHYVKFSSAKLMRIFVLWRQSGEPAQLQQFGAGTHQLNFQYMQRRMAF